MQKQLESYLETRRQQFPRFYFISNDELLAILANSKSLANVQPHLRKLFEAIYALEFQDKDIKAMLSPEGERVPLGMNLKARGSAEVWLPALEGDMVKSLRRYMKRGVTDYERMARRDWVLDKFAQVVCTVGQIAWTRGCEQAISDKNSRVAVARWYDAQIAQLSELTLSSFRLRWTAVAAGRALLLRLDDEDKDEYMQDMYRHITGEKQA